MVRSQHHIAQSTLTAQWTHRLPLFQSAAPAEHATHLLAQVLGNITDSASTPYTVIDFCSGAGGPIPSIERSINAQRKSADLPPVHFRVSDLYPDIDAWIALSAHSAHLSYFPQPLDATHMPPGAVSVARRHRLVLPEDHLDRAGPHAHDEVNLSGEVVLRQRRREERNHDARVLATGQTAHTKVVHLFCLAFHHFDDEQARAVLSQTLGAADAFVVLELQDRSLGCLAMMMFEGWLVLAVSWVWFWGEWGRFALTYGLPVVPVVHWWDGIVSCLRTRTFREMRALIDGVLAEDRREREEDVVDNGHAEDVWPSKGVGEWTLSRVRI
ncbi:hypothetical protein ANO11243_023610 [Dothideomycetidae sp. 11243]|nr:hypothetical protein ANO11243_023610 [fungal sp. No.11243]